MTVKEFFTNKWTRLTCLILFVLATVGLFIGGITQEEISGVIIAITTALQGVAALVALIISLINKKEA